MEKCSDSTGEQGKTLRVIRRSCDQCRVRKVGCDRNSPCSPCSSARLACTHSAVAQSSVGPRQRVLISAQYEQKIDGIAKDIDGIKQLLQTIQLKGSEVRSKTPSALPVTQEASPLGHDTVRESSIIADEIAWKSSPHVLDLIRAIVKEGARRTIDLETTETISTLQKLLRRLESPTLEVKASPVPRAPSELNTTMPPQVSVVAVLRWAKENVSNSRLNWLAQILPLTKFTHICQNIYFSVDGYSDIDYILANGYLSYIFFENLVVSKQPNFAEYSQLCRKNLETALAKLPVLTPSSMNVIAALTLGAYNAVENSQANAAWAFISAASSHCLMLGYNRLRTDFGNAESLTTAEERLFWAVYRLEKGISLRLGRPSCLRNGDVLLPPIPHDIRIRIANIQGRAYDELYSPGSLMRDDFERNCIAKSLAAELRQCIVGTHADIMRAFGSRGGSPTDPFGKAYMQCELVCQYSLLALVLRAVSASVDCSGGVSDECLTVAREALQVHEQCIATIRGCQHEPLMLARYVNWAIVHCPFPPFSILITYVIHSADESELCNLERFAASLEPLGSSVAFDLEQPSHLYRLLCKAVRLYIRFDTTLPTNDTLEFNTSGFSGSSLLDIGWGSSIAGQPQQDPEWLGEWWNGNQLVMGILDQNTYS